MIPKLIPGIHFLALVTVSVVCVYLVRKRGRLPYFRKLPALEAMYESIDRCVEMRRPVLFTLGEASLSGGAVTVAGLAILQEVATKSAEKGAEVILSIAGADTLPVIDSLMRQAYLAAGKPEEYKPENLIFVGGSQFSNAATMLGLFDTRRPGALIFPGSTGWAQVVYGEHAAKVGAVSIGALTNTYQIHYAMASYDWLLLCEDFLAAGAMISKEPNLVSNMWAGDIYRYVLVSFVAVSVILTWLGINMLEFWKI